MLGIKEQNLLGKDRDYIQHVAMQRIVSSL